MSAPGERAARIGPLFLAALLGVAGAGPAPAQEAYFLLVFGSQRIPNQPEYSHSFAAFVRATWPGPPPAPPQLEVHTISWLPRSLRIRVLALAPECGVNMDLHPSLCHALSEGQRISLWGPFQIDRALYYRAVGQVRLLDSGQILYKANDLGYSGDKVNNCIHAISDVLEGNRIHVAIPGWGETASYFIVEEFSGRIVDPCRTHLWVAKALGLDSYPIIYRTAGVHPRSGIIQGPLYRLFGGERKLQVGPPAPAVAQSCPRYELTSSSPPAAR